MLNTSLTELSYAAHSSLAPLIHVARLVAAIATVAVLASGSFGLQAHDTQNLDAPSLYGVRVALTQPLSVGTVSPVEFIVDNRGPSPVTLVPANVQLWATSVTPGCAPAVRVVRQLTASLLVSGHQQVSLSSAGVTRASWPGVTLNRVTSPGCVGSRFTLHVRSSPVQS